MTTLHLSNDDMQRYAAAEFGAKEREAVDSHLGQCDECRETMATLARQELLFHAMWRTDMFCPGCGRTQDNTTCDHCGAIAGIEGYTVVEIINQTNRGRTYLARTESGDPVVIKELVFATAPTSEEIDAFEREAQILRTLDHPGIPHFRASMQTGEGVHKRLYLVQDYIEGQSLASRLEEHRFSEDEVVRMAGEILEILVYLQSRSPMVVHRDVKPDNLLVGSGGHVWLVDFGAARDHGATYSGTLVGTFGYMPIEQLGGMIDGSTDVYALGATIAHLLTRREPWEFLRDGQLSLDGLDVSPGFRAWLERAMARTTSSRFASAEAALEGLRQRDALVTLRGSRWLRPWQWVPVRAMPYAAAAVGGFAVIAAAAAPFSPLAVDPEARVAIMLFSALAAIALWQGRRKRRENEQADESEKKPRAGRIWTAAGCVAAAIAFIVFVSSQQTASESLHEQAHAAYDEGDFAECGELYVDAAQIAPGRDVGEYLFAAARCQARADRLDDSFALLDQALDHGFDNAEKLEHDWDLRLLRKDERWGELVERARAIQSQEAAPWRLRGRAELAYSRGDFKRCADLYARTAEKADDSDVARDWYNAACCAARVGDHDEAFEYLGEAFRWGWDDLEQILEDPDLAPLRHHERWQHMVHGVDDERLHVPADVMLELLEDRFEQAVEDAEEDIERAVEEIEEEVAEEVERTLHEEQEADLEKKIEKVEKVIEKVEKVIEKREKREK